MHVDGGDVHAHRLGVLDRHVAEAADPRDHHPFARPHLRLPETLVDGHSGAQDRSRRTPFEIVRQATDIGWIGQRIFREAAVHGVAAVQLGAAQRLPPGPAVRAVPAGRMQPRNADPIALLDAADGTADRDHRSHAFVARDEGRFWLDGPIAVRGVEVRVADPGRRDANEDLVLVRLRNRYLLDRERLAELADDGCLHRAGHEFLSSCDERRSRHVERQAHRRSEWHFASSHSCFIRPRRAPEQPAVRPRPAHFPQRRASP